MRKSKLPCKVYEKVLIDSTDSSIGRVMTPFSFQCRTKSIFQGVIFLWTVMMVNGMRYLGTLMILGM